MNPAQEQIHTEIGDDYAEEGENAVDVEEDWLVE